jgi:hypothetical protein
MVIYPREPASLPVLKDIKEDIKGEDIKGSLPFMSEKLTLPGQQ